MGLFPVSPGFAIEEIDLTTVVSEAISTPTALAGVFRWGPMFTPVNVAQENPDMLQTFLPPTNFNAETWFTMANFLAYANSGIVTRCGIVTGNSVQVSFTGNATTNSTAANSDTIVVGNTSALSVGMKLFYAYQAGIFADNFATITGVGNSIAVNLSENALIAEQSVTYIFRSPTVFSAVAQEEFSPNINWALQLVANSDLYANVVLDTDPSVNWIARYPGEAGDSLRVTMCDSPAQFSSNVNLQPNAYFNSNLSVITATVGSNVVSVSVAPANTTNGAMIAAANLVGATALAEIQLGDQIEVGNNQIGFQILQVTALSTLTLNATGNVFSFTIDVTNNYRLGGNVSSNTIERFWEFYREAGGNQNPPGQSAYQGTYGNTSANDELHVVIVDDGGEFTGVAGTVLETYINVSRATDAIAPDGGTNYYANVINQNSRYVWWAGDRSGAVSNTAEFLTSSIEAAPYDQVMYGGDDGLGEANVPLSTLFAGYDTFADAEDIEVRLIMQGKARGNIIDANTDLGNYIIQNICEVRQDCVALVSPDLNVVVGNYGFQVDDLIVTENAFAPSSYGSMDSGYKYMYDRYNDVYRWVPLNGDVAGCYAFTDNIRYPWYAAAGFNRGNIKNIVRLAFNPKQADRDLLYPAGVNPVVTFKGKGTVLFGNKTLLNTTSAFSRMNVRRLFIILEQAIKQASNQFLFEFNDAVTWAQFKALVVPYLQDIKSKRGIYDFLVVCDATNNTPQIIDNNQFIGDIYLKPERTIEFGLLRFIAVATGTAFSEVVGSF